MPWSLEYYRTPSDFHWRPQLFIGDPLYSLETPVVHWKPPYIHWRPQLLIGDPLYALKAHWSPIKSLGSPIKSGGLRCEGSPIVLHWFLSILYVAEFWTKFWTLECIPSLYLYVLYMHCKGLINIWLNEWITLYN